MFCLGVAMFWIQQRDVHRVRKSVKSKDMKSYIFSVSCHWLFESSIVKRSMIVSTLVVIDGYIQSVRDSSPQFPAVFLSLGPTGIYK